VKRSRGRAFGDALFDRLSQRSPLGFNPMKATAVAAMATVGLVVTWLR